MITAYTDIFIEKLTRLEARLARMSDENSAEARALRAMLEAEADRLRRVLGAVDTDDRTDLAA